MKKILEEKTINREFQEVLNKVDVRKLKDKKVLVTGANGFLGQYIVGSISLANRQDGLNCTIDAVGLNSPKPVLSYVLENDKKVSYSKIDLSKDFILSDYDLIFHSAGYGQPAKFIKDPYSTVAINIDATRKLIQGSPKATFIFFSSGEIYGDIPEELIPVDESYNGNCPLLIPRSVYAEAKRLGEALCATRVRDFETKIKIVRISLTYGPGLPLEDTRVISDFIKKAMVEKEIKLLDSGKAIKSYGYVTDTVSMILFVALHGKEMVYNVGGKSKVSILDLAQKISKYCKVPYTTPKEISNLAYIGKDPKIIQLNLSKVVKEMKKFKFMPFNNGLKRTIEWTMDQIEKSNLQKK